VLAHYALGQSLGLLVWGGARRPMVAALRPRLRDLFHFVGCYVNGFTGEFVDVSTDLTVKVPGGSISIKRWYYGDVYHEDAYKSRLGERLAAAAADGGPKSPDKPDKIVIIGAPKPNYQWRWDHLRYNLRSTIQASGVPRCSSRGRRLFVAFSSIRYHRREITARATNLTRL